MVWHDWYSVHLDFDFPYPDKAPGSNYEMYMYFQWANIWGIFSVKGDYHQNDVIL